MKVVITLITLYLTFLIFLLIAVAYLTLAERKILAAIQLRRGPGIIGLFGLLQPFADGLKLLMKETIFPRNASQIIFVIAPLITFTFSLAIWVVVPFGPFSVFADIDLGVLFVMAVSSLNVYGIVLAGWASNSKYAFLGAIRSAAQMISYEVSIGFVIIAVGIPIESLNLTDIVLSQARLFYIVPFLPLAIIFFISMLAETNRTPFDLPEAEAELVAGYNVEYSSISFALFFLAEYMHMIFTSVLFSILFLGGWLPIFSWLGFLPSSFWLAVKVCFTLFVFVWVRATLPRYRYDQLMQVGWKVFLPFTFLYLFFEMCFFRLFW